MNKTSWAVEKSPQVLLLLLCPRQLQEEDKADKCSRHCGFGPLYSIFFLPPNMKSAFFLFSASLTPLLSLRTSFHILQEPFLFLALRNPSPLLALLPSMWLDLSCIMCAVAYMICVPVSQACLDNKLLEGQDDKCFSDKFKMSLVKCSLLPFRAPLFKLRSINTLGWIILGGGRLSCALQDVEQHPWPLPAGRQSPPHPTHPLQQSKMSPDIATWECCELLV